MNVRFQSTRPVRGATDAVLPVIRSRDISIHAPRAGRDEWLQGKTEDKSIFQSTRPVRGATSPVLK